MAALHDNLEAWKGLGASLGALWRGRHIGGQLRMRILLVTAFFLAASTLHISTPSVITVGTANVTVTVDVVVNTMPGDLIGLNIDPAEWKTDTSKKNIISALPWIWNQSTLDVGAPAGLNGS